MKNIIITAAVIMAPMFGICQTNPDSLLQKGYLFKDFMKGSVLFKNGATEEYLLNFNTNIQGVEFIKEGQFLMLTNFTDIDTIYLQNRKLIAVEDKFYFIGATTNYPLLISYINKPHPLTASTDHNGTSKQSSGSQSNNTISSYYIQRPFSADYYLEFRKEFWIRKVHTMYKANSEKQFIKIFPSKADKIKEFIKNNTTDFTKEEDIVKLNYYCNSLN